MIQDIQKNTVISEIADQGKGRAFVVIYEPSVYKTYANDLFNEISQSTRCILAEIPIVTATNSGELTAELIKFLESKNVRQASFVGFSDAASIILNLALYDLKLVRSMVLVDAATRPHPSKIQRIVDKIENLLPLGLPLRSHGKGFDAKSFLQRMRCPVLVVTTSYANLYTNSQVEIFKSGLPTAWSVDLNQSNQMHQLKELVIDFQQTPAKCPQKNIS